jgi:hypothetical protein
MLRHEADGLIHTHRGQIELLDKKGLEKQACSCYKFIGRHIDRLVPKSGSRKLMWFCHPPDRL